MCEPYAHIRKMVDDMESEAKHCRMKARLLQTEAETLELQAIRLRNALRDQQKADAERDQPDNRERKDMALLIARLAHALEKANPDSDLPAKATDYLRRKDLLSPLR